MLKKMAASQAFRFVVAGGINTVLTYALYLFLLPSTGYAIAYTISYAAGIGLALLLHARYVFNAAITPRSMVLYPLFYLGQYLLGLAVVSAAVKWFGIAPEYALAISIAINVPLMFMLSRWVFKGRITISPEMPISLAPLRTLLALALLIASALYLAQMAFALYYWGWSQPAFDQYSTYPFYLDRPFPLNVLGNENGHRPIFPALVRVAEIAWFHSDQSLQRAVGALLMALCWLGLLWLALRNDGRQSQVGGPGVAAINTGKVINATIVLACTLAVFWAGSIRMQIHANEQLHVYGSLLGLLLALGALWRMHQGPNIRNFLALCAGAIFATFSFGNGLVVFPAVLILAGLLRVPRRWVAAIFGATVAIALLYARGLPFGNAPTAVDWQYLPQGLVLMTSWLSAVWHGAWLRFAGMDTATLNYVGDLALNTAWVGHSANNLGRSLDLQPDMLAIYVTRAVGAAAIAGCLYALARHIWIPIQSRLQLLALGLILYGLGTGSLIVLFRVNYFLNEGQGQLFADRYIIWSCLWWLGIALYILPLAKASWMKIVLGVGGLLLAWALAFSNYYQLTWARLVDNQLNLQALALRLELVDEAYCASMSTVPITETLAVFAKLKSAKLAQFAIPLIQPSTVTANIAASKKTADWVINSLELTTKFDTKKYPTPVWEFTGTLSRDAERQSPYEFIVLDAHGEACGSAIQMAPELNGYFKLGNNSFTGYYLCTGSPETATLYARSATAKWTSIGLPKR